MSEAISLEQFAGALAGSEEGQPQDEELDPTPQGDEQTEAEPQETTGEEGDETDAAKQESQPTQELSDEAVIQWKTAQGDTYEVPLQELKQGYMRETDYRQKTQNLAEERRTAHQTIQQKFQEVERFAADLGQITAAQQQLEQFEKLDWNGLYEQDPAQATRLQGQYLMLKDKQRELLGGYQAMQQQLASERMQAFHQATQEAVEHLRKAVPNFGDTTLKSMRDYGLKEGFTAQELANVADKRMFMVLHKAAQWDALQAKKPEVANKVKALPPKTTKPGSSAPPPTAIEKAHKQFKAKKDLRSFAQLLELQDK